MLLGELECFAQAREHSEAEHIYLENAERIEIVFVPFDESAIVHRAVADRHYLVERAAGDHEAADMLGQMAGKGLDLDDERTHFLHAHAFEINSCAFELGVTHRAAAHSPDRGGECTYRVFRQAENLADLADGGTAAI